MSKRSDIGTIRVGDEAAEKEYIEKEAARITSAAIYRKVHGKTSVENPKRLDETVTVPTYCGQGLLYEKAAQRLVEILNNKERLEDFFDKLYALRSWQFEARLTVDERKFILSICEVFHGKN